MKYKKYLTDVRPFWIVPAEVIKPYSEHQGEDWKAYGDLLVITGQNIKMKTEELSFKYG